MLNLNGITVRLGGRTILDRATATLPPYSRVGLIGRNGAGKSTLMKVMIGELEADEGSMDMPKNTRIGYIAQEAPSGTATPFETVLAGDVERAALMEEAEHCADPDRLGELHDRLIAIDAYTAPARAAYACYCARRCSWVGVGYCRTAACAVGYYHHLAAVGNGYRST
jgi:ATP-binding cassette subfamily F protein 3